VNTPQPTHDRLKPGEHCRISEDQWALALETHEVLHQWGSAFLVDDGVSVHAYLRDVSGAGRHTAWCFDAERSARAREGVAEVERLGEVAAHRISAELERGGSDSVQREQQALASEAYTAAAEALYEALLRIGKR
jgi:hypothetical protein